MVNLVSGSIVATTRHTFHERIAMAWQAEALDPDWPFELLGTKFGLHAASTALLVIDMQVSQLAPPSSLAQFGDIQQYWSRRVDSVAVPQSQKLLAFFRENGLTVAFTRNGYNTRFGRESTRRLRPAQPLEGGYLGHPDFEIDPRLAPADDEIVVDKLTSGGFTCTWLDHALRNMGVTAVVVTGVLSDMCVFGTARAAAEIGYDTMICEDACATFTQRAHDEAMLMHARKFGRVAQADDVIAELQPSLAAAKR